MKRKGIIFILLILIIIVLSQFASSIWLDEDTTPSVPHSGDYYLLIGTLCTKPQATALFYYCAWNPPAGDVYGCFWVNSRIGMAVSGNDLKVQHYRCSAYSRTQRSTT